MKRQSKVFKMGILMSLGLFLSACSRSTEPLSSSSSGFWDRYVLYYLSQFILWLSDLFGGNYALGIIVFTVLIRVLLLPVTHMQIKSQRKMQEIQPELNRIKKKYPNRDSASMEMMQKEQQALMDKHDVNQLAGCLSLFIQLPVMMALYQTIQRTHELNQGHFFWTSLGSRDPYLILPILAAILTFLTSYMTMKSQPEKNPAMSVMLYLMPLMIFFIGFSLPAAISLYWVVSNAFTLGQTMLLNNPYKIIAEREAKLQAEKDKQKRLDKALKKATRKK